MLLIAFQNVLKLTYGLRQSRISKNFPGKTPYLPLRGGGASDAAAQRKGGEGNVNGDVGEAWGGRGMWNGRGRDSRGGSKGGGARNGLHNFCKKKSTLGL